MDYREHYKPEVLQEYDWHILWHLARKFEFSVAIMEIRVGNMSVRHVAVNGLRVVKKAVTYWNQKADNVSAKWYFVKDVKNRIDDKRKAEVSGKSEEELDRLGR